MPYAGRRDRLHQPARQLDAAERQVRDLAAVKDVFGEHARNLVITSTKSMVGHMFGAAGAIEALACIKAIETGIIPPTINYETPDPDCDLDYAPNVARERKVRAAMSNSFGLGGHNSQYRIPAGPRLTAAS